MVRHIILQLMRDREAQQLQVQALLLSRHSAADQWARDRGATAARQAGAASASKLLLLSRCTQEIAWEHAHVLQGRNVKPLA